MALYWFAVTVRISGLTACLTTAASLGSKSSSTLPSTLTEVNIHLMRSAQRILSIARVVLAVGSVKAGEALGRDAEFVALRVVHYGPALAGYLVCADDRGTKPD